ncbi:MAG: repair protein RecO [Thermoleophilia bacterium]|nr:repair protein RecO [Thermoleophilia bacterium]
MLRTLRYGEADLIAHLLTRHGGRRGVIAKGARKPKSRLGARLEPFLAVSLQLVESRGDLDIVRGVEVLAAHDALRSSWRSQQLGAAALDLVTRLSVEHEPNEQMFHLLRNFLDLLDSTAARTPVEAIEDERRGAVLLAAFQLKLLHVVGIAPQLGACVRCGAASPLAAYSARDGGVICSGCRTAEDQTLDAPTHAAAVTLMRSPLAELVTRAAEDLPEMRVLRTVGSGIVAATAQEHAGIRPR